jgi:GNAT superfamily N-acetyltransferase
MTADDVSEVVRIIRLHDDDDARHARRYFLEGPAFDDRPEHGHLVVEDPEDSAVVGVSGWNADRGEGEGVFWLGWTYINPWKEGLGAGRMLLHAVLDRVRELGGRKMFLDTSSLPKYERAVRFYERNGFEQEGRLRDYYGPGDDQILMGLAL